MKNYGIIFGLLFSLAVNAQNPVEYMENLNANNEQIMQSNWQYLSAIARSKSAKKVEKMRQQVESSVRVSIKELNQLGSYQGDDSYRQAALAFQNFTLDMLTGKTEKLVNMEEISQQSYDMMEAYILYQRELNRLNEEESEKVRKAQEVFAKTHQINLIDGGKSALLEKLEKGSQVLSYQEDMFLVYARCSMYEQDMLSRIDSDEEYNFTQAGLTLLDLVDKSRTVMDTITDINNDKSLREANIRALNFYEDEAETLIPVVAEFKKSLVAFTAFKETFEATPKAKKTQEMVDEFNSKANAINKQSQTFVNLLNRYNEKRTQLFNNWNQISDNFINKYMPND